MQPMTKHLQVLSLFSGVGGFDIGLERAGMQTAALCEIDPWCQKVLRKHWSDIPIYGDVSTLTAEQLLGDGVKPDVVVFGSPCQDLSVAGKRAGMAGSRSGLFGEAVRIIRELRQATHGQYPTFAVWENVVGALSSTQGDDFAAVLDSLADAGALVLEWAVLDAQHFGVPQRRRRIFLVACFDPATASKCPDPLLPVRQGSPRDLAKSRKAKQGATPDVAACLRSGGDGGVPSSRGEHLVAVEHDHIPFRQGSFGGYVEGEFGTLKASGGDLSGGSETILIDGTRRDDVRVSMTDTMQTLTARMGTGGNNVPVVGQEVAYIVRQREGEPGGGKDPLVSEDAPLTLATSNDQYSFAPIGFSHTQGLSAQPSEVAFPTLRAEGSGHAVAYDEYNDSLGDVHHALRAGTRQSTGVMQNLAVRRLTPNECERLMGWADDHTRWTADGAEVADSHRYRMCGNGIASPVAEWVGRQLVKVVQS